MKAHTLNSRMEHMKGHRASIAQETGKIIREARSSKHLTQEELAEEANVSDRTVRKWELGMVSPTLDHRETLVRVLDIKPELLGIQEQTDFSPEEALALLVKAEAFFGQGALMTAFSNADLLVRNLTRQAKRGDAGLLMLLIRARCLKGLAVSVVENNPSLALHDFEEMERLASKIAQQAWLCLAKMYQADMYRRMGDYQKALRFFAKVREELNDDHTLIGHYQQLLARVYSALDNVGAALKAIDEAKRYALMSQEQSSNLAIFFDLCSVYIDCANIHIKSGNIGFGLNYIKKAESIGKRAPYWLPSIQILKGILLINKAINTNSDTSASHLDDPDYLEGQRLFNTGRKLAMEYGDQRLAQHARRLINSFWQRGNKYLMVVQDLGEDPTI